MARKRNPRRVLLEQLRDMKRRLDRVISGWDVAGTVYEPHTEIRRCNPEYYRGQGLPIGDDGLVEVKITQGKWRKRLPEEYPENITSEWAYAIHALDAVINEASKARAEAYDHWKRLYDAK